MFTAIFLGCIGYLLWKNFLFSLFMAMFAYESYKAIKDHP